MYSKYEVYTTTASVYCYPGTDVLKNRLGIKDTEILKKAENEITSVKQYEMLRFPVKGRFTKSHLMNIHKHMFEDIYNFAGKIRREQISKGRTAFYPPAAIEKELERVFKFIMDNHQLSVFDGEEFYDALAYVMAELNIIHPFREGNGRTIREFIRLLAFHNGIQINWGNVDHKEILDASILSVDDHTILKGILKASAEK